MTQRTPPLDEADLDLLSAYIDEQLSAAERSAFEERLGREPALRQALDELRATVHVLRTLPQVAPPRSFTLDPSVAPARPWYAWLTPELMRFGSALAAVLLVITFIPDLLSGLVGNFGLGGAAAPAAAAPTPAAAYSPALGGSAGIAAMPTANMELQRQMPAEASQQADTAAPAATAAEAVIGSAATAEATQGPAPKATAPAIAAATAASAAQPLASNPQNPAGAIAPAPPQLTPASGQGVGGQDSMAGGAPIATSGSSSPGTAQLDQPPAAPPQLLSQPQPAQQISPSAILRIILAVAVVGLGLASWRLRREA
jgi:hypothetical protein